MFVIYFGSKKEEDHYFLFSFPLARRFFFWNHHRLFIVPDRVEKGLSLRGKTEETREQIEEMFVPNLRNGR